MKVYKIDKDKIEKYLIKQALIRVSEMMIAISPLVIIFLCAAKFRYIGLILTKLAPWVFIFLLAVFFLTFFSYNVHQARRFIITDDSFNQIQADEDVDVVSKFFQKRAESKTGQSKNQFIPFSQIAKVKISNYSITIKAKDYNFMNANGKIIIPCEVENYQEITALTRSIIKNIRGIEFIDKQK